MSNLVEKKKKLPYKTKKAKCDSISYTTGDIGLNINHFNKRMGTFGIGSDTASEAIGGEGGGLCESKRYVRRYYIRPQNIFCSNKAEILKALIDLDNANCSVYTLNNLGDEKDVSKLMNSDIIYYYDDGILYDKNKVKVMDYDLSIKKEEKRKHFANVDKASDTDFKNAYEDRMTDATELEEDINANKLGFTINELKKVLDQTDYPVNFGEGELFGDACIYQWDISKPESPDDKFCVTGWGYDVFTEEDGIERSEYFDTLEDAYKYMVNLANTSTNFKVIPLSSSTNEAFDLDFDDYNVFGEKLTEAKENFCCICGEPLEGYGNNPEPFTTVEAGQCCDACNLKFVLPLRMEMMKEAE
jgi:hypothetical protein